MSDFIRTLNKYLILLIISALFGVPWMYAKLSIVELTGYYQFYDQLPTIVDYVTKLVIIVFLIRDFKKDKLGGIVLTCIATLLYPLLGVVILAVLLIDKEKKPLHNNT